MSQHRRQPRSATARYWAECARALAVVALVFLNFGLGPARAVDYPVFGVQSLCGDGHLADAEHGDHHPSTCHACRVDGAVLPPQPDELDLVLRLAGPVEHHAVAPAPRSGRLLRVGSPRGPPRG